MKPAARPLVLFTILIAAYVVAYDGSVDGNLDFLHEGDRLGHIDKLRSGGLPFRDIYVQHGLGEDILKPALACKLWGDSVASLRRLGQNAFIYRGYLPPLGLIATLLVVQALTRSLRMTGLAGLALLTCWYEITERHALGLLAVACAGNYLHSRRGYWLCGSGLLSVLAALYSLEVGLFCGASIVGWILITGVAVDKRIACREFGLFILGALPPLAGFLIWCATYGIVGDFLHNLKGQLFMRSAAMSTSYPGLEAAAGFWTIMRRLIHYYVMPISVVGGGLVAIRRMAQDRSPTSSAVLLAALTALTFWISVWGRPDDWHVAFAVGPFVIFAATMYGAGNGRKNQRVARAAAMAPIMASIATLLAIGSGGALLRWVNRSSASFHQDSETVTSDLASCPIPRLSGMRIGRMQAGFVNALVHYIHGHSGADDTILDLANFGLIYFLAERQAPTRFDLEFHVGHSPLREEMAREIRGRSPLPTIVIRPDMPLRQGDVLDDIVAQYYVSDAKIGSLELWLRATPR